MPVFNITTASISTSTILLLRKSRHAHLSSQTQQDSLSHFEFGQDREPHSRGPEDRGSRQSRRRRCRQTWLLQGAWQRSPAEDPLDRQSQILHWQSREENQRSRWHLHPHRLVFFITMKKTFPKSSSSPLDICCHRFHFSPFSV